MQAYTTEKQALIEIGRLFYQRQWSVGTSSNYSMKLRDHPLRILITASGKDKGALTPEDFVLVDASGKSSELQGSTHPSDVPTAVPSAETMLHVVPLKKKEFGAVLHTHSVWSTLLSDKYYEQGYLELAGYEMLKGLEGIRTHESSVRLQIFDNTQDIAKLASEVEQLLGEPGEALRYGFLLR
ncbi:MAG TPA: methylthioribulose 1-phosphate dehydratase, partial [Gemmatales bacterium]|nr:methylthioribulose 1-phosphate dehydratase [Gemmatales bacterium]